ncbi:MAG: hypothetical protein U0641_03710 [Anaerolineae bacterium]
MAQSLSPEQVTALLPLLPEVVRLVVAGGHPAANELEMLLAGAGLDDDPYRAELQRWSNILTAARASTDPSRRDLAGRSLMMRGVPEADATQAADAVTADTGVAAAAAAAPPPARADGPPWWWIAAGTALILLLLLGALWFSSRRLGQTALVPPVATVLPTTAAAYPAPPTVAPLPTRNAYPAPTTAAPVAVAPTQAPPAAPSKPPTTAPTSAPTRPPGPTGTATRSASPTPRPPTRTPGPTPTLSPAGVACFPLIAPYLAGLWRFEGLEAAIGCPIGTPQNVVTAVEEFERGFMFYRQDNGLIYALYNDGTAQVFQDSWRDGDAEYSCPDVSQSKTPPTPRRGIGKVWCNESGVRDKLGLAKGDEQGYSRPIQQFERGFMFATGDPPTVPWVVYNDSQRWKKG